MSNENKLQDIIQTSLENIRSMIDANTVVGNPICTENGVTIIPVSKISMGFASGGLDYDKKNTDKASVQFGGGGGTGLNITPVAFLVVRADGFVDIINVNSKLPADPVEQVADLIERSPEIIAKLKAIFTSDKSKDDAKNEQKVTKA